jgi:hypothetical protein
MIYNPSKSQHGMATHLLDGLAVEHAYWKGEVLGSNLSWKSISLIRDFDLSAQEETDKTLISCFFHLTIFFAPCNSPRLCTGTLHLHQKKDPISCPILTTISVAIIPRYRDTRYWYPILTPISGYHVTDIGTPDIVPDIDPDIRYVVYDIGDMMTRYRVSTRYRYPISGHMRHVPISGQKKTPISGHMTRYRVSG